MSKKFLRKYYQNSFIQKISSNSGTSGNNLIAIIIIFLFTLLLRLILLNKFPIGITHDELNYVMSAKSLFLTGRFIPQTAPAILPISMSSYGVVIAEIPALILTPFIGIFNLSLFSSRFFGAILSSLTVLVIYYLIIKLLKDRLLAYIAAILLAVNPWSFLMGRSAFEVNFFSFFFLLGFLILLKNKDWKIFYSLPIYLLGFLSYTGGQLAFYIFIVMTLVYHYQDNVKKHSLPYLFYFMFTTLIFVSYLFLTFHNQTGSVRKSELFLPTSSEISQEVNKERLLSLPGSFNRFFINKVTVYAKGYLERYLGAFSPDTLFLNGEFRAAFSYQMHGTFYVIDTVLILLGLSFLFLKNRKVWLLLIVLMAAAPVTSGLSSVEHSYSQRAGLMYPFIIIFIAAGFSYLVSYCRSRRFGNFYIILFILIYMLFFVNLMHIYFFRFPVYASDGWFYQDRLLSRYIELVKEKEPDRKVFIYSSEPRITFEEYLFFSDSYNKLTAEKINQNLNVNDFSLNGVNFIGECPGNGINLNEISIYDALLNCNIKKQDVIRITRFQDVLEKYLIVNDGLCNGINLGKYVDQSAFRNFDVSYDQASIFCSNWLSRI